MSRKKTSKVEEKAQEKPQVSASALSETSVKPVVNKLLGSSSIKPKI